MLPKSLLASEKKLELRGLKVDYIEQHNTGNTVEATSGRCECRSGRRLASRCPDDELRILRAVRDIVVVATPAYHHHEVRRAHAAWRLLRKLR